MASVFQQLSILLRYAKLWLQDVTGYDAKFLEGVWILLSYEIEYLGIGHKSVIISKNSVRYVSNYTLLYS